MGYREDDPFMKKIICRQLGMLILHCEVIGDDAPCRMTYQQCQALIQADGVQDEHRHCSIYRCVNYSDRRSKRK